LKNSRLREEVFVDSPVAASARPLEGQAVTSGRRQGFETREARPLALGPIEQALASLGQFLLQTGYAFTTITPVSHRRVSARQREAASSLRDIFGWNRPFRRSDVPKEVVQYLEMAGALDGVGPRARSRVRYSTLEDQIFVHSAFPTDEADAVFFGPDTYRFARLLRQTLQSIDNRATTRLIDVGAGSGAGGLYAARLLGEGTSTILGDINRKALRYSRVNAALNNIHSVQVIESDLFEAVSGLFDLAIANPPYLIDSRTRLYRHGGGQFGEGLSLRIVSEGVRRLASGGRLILYTGTAIIDGVDHLHVALRSMLAGTSMRLSYEEIDPDVFGEELDHPPYDRVDRIAVVAATIVSPKGRRGYL
jgi:methylase of polypeptide subunit release factors